MWSPFKNLVGKREVSDAVYLKRMIKPDSDLFFPDKVIEGQFKLFVKLAYDNKDETLLYEQAEAYIKYARTGNFEEFTGKFNKMKSSVQEYLVEHIDAILGKYNKLESAWEVCVTKYPQIVDNFYYDFVEMEKIRANTNICKEKLVTYRENVIDAMESGDIEYIMDVRIVLERFDGVASVLKAHNYMWADLFSRYMAQPEVFDFFTSLILLV